MIEDDIAALRQRVTVLESQVQALIAFMERLERAILDEIQKGQK